LEWKQVIEETPKRKRPTSVTVISWIFIVTGTLSLIMSLMTLYVPTAKFQELIALNPNLSQLPLSLLRVQYVLAFGGLLVVVISGTAMLQGHNWARLLYVAWEGVARVVGFIIMPVKLRLIPSALVYLIFVLLLFRPKANRFFTASPVSSADETH